MVVVLMLREMGPEAVDALGQYRYLHFGRPCVGVVYSALPDDLLLTLGFHCYLIVPPLAGLAPACLRPHPPLLWASNLTCFASTLFTCPLRGGPPITCLFTTFLPRTYLCSTSYYI